MTIIQWLSMVWHATPTLEASSWHVPIMNRSACVDGPAAEAFRYALACIAQPPPSTPVDAVHAFVVGASSLLADFTEMAFHDGAHGIVTTRAVG